MLDLPRALDGTGTEAATAAEMAACLRRFLTATADEQTLRRAEAALEAWNVSQGRRS
ncbi:MAG TPA: hypothetical protein VHL53_16710 [Acidimicrobiia bacterium]|nr:hypothetical protein [Acidimicrobiia bacterium]